MNRFITSLLTACVACATLSGCFSGSAKVSVFAASSLADVLPTIAAASYSFDGSSGLVDQLSAGAPADVLITADTATMERARKLRLVEEPVAFATNVLVLVTPAANPGKVFGVADLQGRALVVCDAMVPCGRASAKLLSTIGVSTRPVSFESKVSDVLGKVTSGEADAGIVYSTNALKAGALVQTFPIPQAQTQRNSYWVAITAGAKRRGEAAAFIESLLSADGTKALTAAGFEMVR